MSIESKRIPKVRLAKPTGRTIQLRYTDPGSGKEVRIKTGTHDEVEALEQKKAKLLAGAESKRPAR